MEMGSGYASGPADQSDYLSWFDGVADRNQDLGLVEVSGEDISIPTPPQKSNPVWK